ncbi:MAG: glycoside hydrolase family 15 protein [Gammaproteobacteria bacterium]
MESFGEWLDREYRYAAAAMLRSISPVDLVKRRPGFGQTIRAVKGAIIASPVLADWNPEPDYFFHWFRDSAVIIDALRVLHEEGTVGPEALTHVADFVRFSLSLRKLDGRALVAEPAWRTGVVEKFTQYLRQDADLAAAHGEAVVADTRVNADGTLDISNWSRPQHDGAPLRALAMLRWAREVTFDAAVEADVSELIRSDLAFTFEHAREPSFDMWEEEKGLHYHSLCVSAAALEEGADWLETRGDTEAQPHRAQAHRAQAHLAQAHLAQAYRAEAKIIRKTLDGFWLAEAGYYRSRVLPSEQRSSKELDIAVILAAIHSGSHADTHSVRDPRMHASLARLEALFEADYAINHNRSPGTGPAMGRYAGDVYFSGGAYYFSTLGAAEFCFRAAAGSEATQAWVQRGDAYLATVRAFTPASGELSEQFDQRTGQQTSARHLAWSYAAFITCVTARRAVVKH